MTRRTAKGPSRPTKGAEPGSLAPPRGCRFEGQLYRRAEDAVDRGYNELFEARRRRYEGCSDS